MFYSAWLLTLLVRSQDRFATQWAVFAVDLVLLVLLAGLALRSDRYWPLFITGFHLLNVLTHVGRILDSGMPRWAYHTAALIWGYLMIAALAVGTANRLRERRQMAAMAAPTAPPGATRR